MWKFATKARFTYINKRQTDFAILRGFYFHETSYVRSFAKIKFSRKFPNLQYLHSKRLKQTLSPDMVLLFRTIKKTREFKQTDKWETTRESLSSGFPTMHDLIKSTC